MLINTFLAFIMLAVFIIGFLFFSFETARRDEEYSDQILETISNSINDEITRLNILTRQGELDKSILFATADKLGVEAFVTNSMEVSEKLSFLQSSLPYSQKVYVYVNSTKKVISVDNAVTSEESFLSSLQLDLTADETLPDFSTIKETGFYSFNKYSLYVSNVLDKGLIVIRLNGNQFCNLDMLYDTLPYLDFIVLNKAGDVFASSDKEKNDLSTLLPKEYGEVIKIDYMDETLEITSKELGGCGFELLLIRRPNIIDRQQSTLYLISIIAGIFVCAACSLAVYFNKLIYLPLRDMSKKLDASTNQNELRAISDRIEKLVKENSEMAEQLEVQEQTQTNIALNYVLRSPSGISDDINQILEQQFGKFWIAVIAAQDNDGTGINFLEDADAYLSDVLSCKPLPIDSFCHAYMVPARKSVREGRDALLDVMQKHMNSSMVCAAGASNFYDSVSDLQKAVAEAQKRMLSNPLPNSPTSSESNCYICLNDLPAQHEGHKMISLEIQNTVAGYILNGNETEIKNILQNVLFSNPKITLQEFISLFGVLTSLLQVILFSSNTTISLESLKTTRLPHAYNPVFMYTCLLSDCMLLNEELSSGQTAFRYQITEYLQQHYDEPLNLEGIADEFGITSVYLSTWFKKNIGINLSVYLSNLRMEKAKEILCENPAIKINELTLLIGIHNTPTFIRQFKNYTGATPDQYRKMNMGNEPHGGS